MTLKNLSKFVRYSGIWVSFVLNPYHWRLVFEFMQPDELNPKMRGFYFSLLPLTVRIVVDDGTW